MSEQIHSGEEAEILLLNIWYLGLSKQKRVLEFLIYIEISEVLILV